MLADKVGGFGNLIKIALKMAFWPIFAAIGWVKLLIAGAKKLAGFFGGLFGGGEDAAPKKKSGRPPNLQAAHEASSPAVSMANGGVVTTPTPAILGDAGAEAAVPLGKKFDLTETNSKFDTLIAQNKILMEKLIKKTTEIGVAG